MNKFSPRSLITALAGLGAAGTASAQLLTWDAGGDAVSVYQEANWTAPDGVAGTDPAADAVNPDTGAVVDEIPGPGLIFDFLVGGTATAGGAGGAGPNFDLTDGTTLTIEDDAVFRMGSFGVRGQNAFDDLTRGNIVLRDNGTFTTLFTVEIDISVFDAADLEYRGGGNPVNASTVDLATDWTGELRFLNELSTDVETEHLSKITVGGAAAVIGSNVQIVNDGNTGSILTLFTGGGLDDADLDQDGDVDDADFALFFAAFSGPGVPTGNPAADLDGDNDTDDADFGLAFAAFTGPGGGVPAPEPTSLALLGLGGLLVARRRR